MLWLLETEVFKDDLIPFIETLKNLGEKYEIHKFGTTYEQTIQTHEIDENIVFHGSYQFARLIKNSTKWKGVFCNFSRFECVYYYPRFGKYLLNCNYTMFPFGDVDQIWRHDLFKNYKLFIKPSIFKLFNGQVVTIDGWEQLRKILSFKVNPEDIVLFSPVHNVIKEWRTVIFNNEVITACQYKENDEIVRIKDVPKSIIEYANHVLKNVKFNPIDPIWVMDICTIEDHHQVNQVCVLEVGPFACCGLYSCEPEPIIKAIKHIVGEGK